MNREDEIFAIIKRGIQERLHLHLKMKLENDLIIGSSICNYWNHHKGVIVKPLKFEDEHLLAFNLDVRRVETFALEKIEKIKIGNLAICDEVPTVK